MRVPGGRFVGADVGSARHPAGHNAAMSVHTLQTVVVGNYTAASGGVHQPAAAPGSFVFDFVQNMAGIATLRVTGCAAGTVIRLKFGEILWPSNGTVHNQFSGGGSGPGGMAQMLANDTCSGSESEVYTTQLSSFGFRYVELTGLPGVPTPGTLTAHFLGPDFPRAAQFNSSLGLLDQIRSSVRTRGGDLKKKRRKKKRLQCPTGRTTCRPTARTASGRDSSGLGSMRWKRW